MKVLFSALHFGFLRNFESLIRELAARGHDVVLLADEREELGGQDLADDLAQHPNVRWEWSPSYEQETWFRIARKVRHGLDYLRFLEPRYADFPKLRDRAAERAPRLVAGAMRLPILNTSIGRRTISRGLDAVDAGMPRHAAMDAWLTRERPDVALFASATNPRAPQQDHLRSARALGIRTGICVYSWDHLSSKTRIRVVPDRVFVWNDTQKREAIELHGLPADRVIVTGAQVYDQWFGRQPSRTRAEFSTSVGLPSNVDLILYVCSALTPDPRESRFVRHWLQALRGSNDPRVRQAAVLIRPHPERREEWRDVDWGDLGPVVIAGRNPLTPDSKADYFDALYYSGAVVGLVTSAFLEAAIVGRPVLTVTPPELHAHQRGMLHFRYLLEIEDGLLTVAQTLAEHVPHVEAALNGRLAYESKQRRFLQAFVRPHGLDTPATPVFADAVERLASVSPATMAATATWQRALCRSLITAADSRALRPLMRDAREVDEERQRATSVKTHRRERQLKWRRHRRQKLKARVQWELKRVRDLVR